MRKASRFTNILAHGQNRPAQPVVMNVNTP
jgi:hypothetical protein